MDKLNSIAIVIPDADLVLSSVSATYKILNSAIRANGTEVEIIIAGSRKNHQVFDGLFSIHASVLYTELQQVDLIIIPAIKSDIDIAIEKNQALALWLSEQYAKGAHLASFCSGAFLLGSSGVLDHRRCTTHWMQTEYFRQKFPKAIHLKHNILTEDERIFTSGGAFTFLNLVIYLVERFWGKEIAQMMTGIFQIDHDRRSQDHFVLFNSQKNHLDNQIKGAQQYIEENYMRKLSLTEISDKFNMSERTIMRRFKAACGNTPIGYLQRVRIEKAKELLTNSRESITQIQYMVGYNDAKTFRTIFSRQTGFSPSAYRKRYSVVAS